MDLFDLGKKLNNNAPLASRLRPRTLSDVVGQEHILGEGKLLSRAIMADKISSIIFYGPPGTGKTSIAHVIACTTKSNFKQINATTSGKKDMQVVVDGAIEDLSLRNTKTILFIDEIHRFNKAQQDFLLPYVEDGTIILIGATTENPYFEVNRALLSRSLVFELKPLSSENIKSIINKAVYDEEVGMGSYNACITDEAVAFLSNVCSGDARAAINAIELAVLTTDKSEDGKIHITPEVASECIQKRLINYDKTGDNHYDTISAFIKSMRGSDPDAAVYYLARMLYAGEDPVFIARRIMICASEDVGLADPRAISVAAAASIICERVGMPEARIPLAEAAIYVATAPKSNASYLAVENALKAVNDIDIKTIPPYLKDAHYDGAGKLGHGIGYKYAHDFNGHYVKQQYLPDELVGTKFFNPGINGYENTIHRYLEFCKELETKSERED